MILVSTVSHHGNIMLMMFIDYTSFTANKVIILLCGTPLLGKAEELVYQNLYGTVKENEKGFIAWVKDGRLSVDTDVLAQLLNPALATTPEQSTKECSNPNQCSLAFRRTTTTSYGTACTE